MECPMVHDVYPMDSLYTVMVYSTVNCMGQ